MCHEPGHSRSSRAGPASSGPSTGHSWVWVVGKAAWPPSVPQATSEWTKETPSPLLRRVVTALTLCLLDTLNAIDPHGEVEIVFFNRIHIFFLVHKCSISSSQECLAPHASIIGCVRVWTAIISSKNPRCHLKTLLMSLCHMTLHCNCFATLRGHRKKENEPMDFQLYPEI